MRDIRAEYIEEGMEKGMEKGRLTSLSKLCKLQLELKFSPLTKRQLTIVEAATPERLEQLLGSIFEVESIDDALEILEEVRV